MGTSAEPSPVRREAGEWEKRFVARLRVLRKHHNLSAVQLAERCAELGAPKIDRNVIQKIETRTRGVGLDEAMVISAALGVSIGQMVSPEPLVIEIKVELP